MNKLVKVVACALCNQNKILLSQRPEGKHMAGLWEFPGGKVEEGETNEQALVREMYEELNLKIEEVDLKYLSSVVYEYDDFTLDMKLYVAHKWQNEIFHNDAQKTAWVTADEMINLSMPPADMPLLADVCAYVKLNKIAI